MKGITSWHSIQECEVADALTISAVENEDTTFKAWIVSHDGMTMEIPRCQIAIKVLENDTEALYTITIPDEAEQEQALFNKVKT